MTKEEQLKEIIRLSKLHEINGRTFTPTLKPIKGWMFKSKLFKTLEEINNENFIITGSIALKCYGLTNKEPKDIDIILINEDFKYKSANNRYNNDKEVYGYSIKNGINIDYFLNDDSKWIEVDGFKIHNLYQLMKHKSDLNRSKDYTDLMILSNKLKLY